MEHGLRSVSWASSTKPPSHRKHSSAGDFMQRNTTPRLRAFKASIRTPRATVKMLCRMSLPPLTQDQPVSKQLILPLQESKPALAYFFGISGDPSYRNSNVQQCSLKRHPNIRNYRSLLSRSSSAGPSAQSEPGRALKMPSDQSWVADGRLCVRIARSTVHVAQFGESDTQ